MVQLATSNYHHNLFFLSTVLNIVSLTPNHQTKGQKRATPNRLGLTQTPRVIDLTDSHSDPSTTASHSHLGPSSSTFIPNLNPYTPKINDNISTPSDSGSGAAANSAVTSGSGTRVSSSSAVAPGFGTHSNPEIQLALSTDEEQELPATTHIAPVENPYT